MARDPTDVPASPCVLGVPLHGGPCGLPLDMRIMSIQHSDGTHACTHLVRRDARNKATPAIQDHVHMGSICTDSSAPGTAELAHLETILTGPQC